jgi:hypothetical protein
MKRDRVEEKSPQKGEAEFWYIFLYRLLNSVEIRGSIHALLDEFDVLTLTCVDLTLALCKSKDKLSRGLQDGAMRRRKATFSKPHKHGYWANWKNPGEHAQCASLNKNSR